MCVHLHICFSLNHISVSIIVTTWVLRVSWFFLTSRLGGGWRIFERNELDTIYVILNRIFSFISHFASKKKNEQNFNTFKRIIERKWRRVFLWIFPTLDPIKTTPFINFTLFNTLNDIPTLNLLLKFIIEKKNDPSVIKNPILLSTRS